MDACQRLPFEPHRAIVGKVEQCAVRLLPRLLAALDGRGWVTARRLASELDTNDRVIREAASLSDGDVISGQKGYALTRQASVEDVYHAAAWLRSQAGQMTQRAVAIERRLHRRTA